MARLMSRVPMIGCVFLNMENRSLSARTCEAAERSSSAAAAASVSYELPETETAAAVCCSAWFGVWRSPDGRLLDRDEDEQLLDANRMLAALPVEHRPALGLRGQHGPEEPQPEHEGVPGAD